MKSLTINLMLATAALMVASTVASAQTVSADIPFAFRADGKLMSAGNYRVVASNAESQLAIHGKGSAVVLTQGIREDAPQAWQKAGKAVLEFACYNDAGCMLKRIWTGNDGVAAHEFGPPNRERGDGKSLAAVRLILITAK